MGRWLIRGEWEWLDLVSWWQMDWLWAVAGRQIFWCVELSEEEKKEIEMQVLEFANVRVVRWKPTHPTSNSSRLWIRTAKYTGLVGDSWNRNPTELLNSTSMKQRQRYTMADRHRVSITERNTPSSGTNWPSVISQHDKPQLLFRDTNAQLIDGE